MKIIKIVTKLVEYLVFIALLAVLFVVGSPLLPSKTIIATYVVSSGSMEPTIHTGSVILSRPIDVSTLAVNDIITFTSPDDPKKVIVHRIVEIKDEDGAKTFITKGDNNNTKDNWVITSSLIKGKSVGQIPYIGFAINYLKTTKGFVIGIGIPALILILLELKKIKEGIDEEIKRRTEKEVGRLKYTEVVTLALLITGLLVFARPVQAYFSSMVSLTGITLSVANFNQIEYGDVIINQIHLPDSSEFPDDQWIELMNTTNHEIDISQWLIENATEQNGNHRPNIHLNGNARIAANGYYVITRRRGNTSTKIGDEEAGNLWFDPDGSNGLIRLFTKDGLLIDEKQTLPWPAPLQSLSIDLTLSLTNKNHQAHFELKGPGLSQFTNAHYDLTYLGDDVPQSITGSLEIINYTTESSKNIDLGMCSTEGTCVYPIKISQLKLKVILKDDTIERTLTQEMPN